MAKTRIKTTPTRLQKDALMASASTVTAATAITKPVVTTYHTTAPPDDVKKRLRNPAALPKPMQSGTSTIIVTAPKRTNSISSIASSISQISDAHSDTESPPPTAMAATTTTTKSTKSLLVANASSQAPRTLNSLLCKQAHAHSTPRNRKVFMITEKSDEPSGAETSTTTATPGQKRKMYLIMEENSCAEDGEEDEGAGGSKKLTLFADKADSGTLTEKFEKILPEILNRIQAKDTGGGAVGAVLTSAPPTVTSKLLNGSTNLNIIKSEPIQQQQQQQPHFQLKQEHNNKAATEANNERLPITLPPKKNRTKIITTHLQNTAYNDTNISDNSIANSVWGNYNNSSSSSSNNSINNNNSSQKIGAQCHIKQISAATPVIVSAVTMHARHNNTSSNNNSHVNNNNNTSEIKRFAPKQSNNINTTTNTNIRYASNCNGHAVTSMAQVELVPQKNINLSTDFHFLIKMLPKLESIPEPHKNNVKNCIEKIITQNANIFAKQ
ncbi:putative mediator of RNA polymerase II transcription subunit 26 isoform X2 [Zeugodacus cucurbitae]|uniref:putative mediator of RNA polymerase II transcription subunit 26 isoform X2 n=1 Tax=Zeugodacus cucurbitae TaxID=28588 RepID=UPI0023D94F8B|nr:putative mediator of RNA polymerase II transcription subunit 26 isoform X2 [Zeugodacus cucurbitae]